jgi:hypothetical protein
MQADLSPTQSQHQKPIIAHASAQCSMLLAHAHDWPEFAQPEHAAMAGNQASQTAEGWPVHNQLEQAALAISQETQTGDGDSLMPARDLARQVQHMQTQLAAVEEVHAQTLIQKSELLYELHVARAVACQSRHTSVEAAVQTVTANVTSLGSWCTAEPRLNQSSSVQDKDNVERQNSVRDDDAEATIEAVHTDRPGVCSEPEHNDEPGPEHHRQSAEVPIKKPDEGGLAKGALQTYCSDLCHELSTFTALQAAADGIAVAMPTGLQHPGHAPPTDDDTKCNAEGPVCCQAGERACYVGTEDHQLELCEGLCSNHIEPLAGDRGALTDAPQPQSTSVQNNSLSRQVCFCRSILSVCKALARKNCC